eukprot:gene15594-23802_t
MANRATLRSHSREQKYEHDVESPAKHVAFKTPPSSSGGSALKIILAFFAGSAATYGFLVYVKPSALAPPRGPVVENLEVRETINLLPTIDLDQYSALVAQKQLTLRQLARQPRDTVEEGFKPFHFRRLVAEGGSEAAAGEEKEDTGMVVESSEDGDHVAAESSENGDAGSEGAEDVSRPSTGQGTAGAPSGAAKAIPGAIGQSPRAPRTLPPPPPPPTFSPPPTVPAICESLARSRELKQLWMTWKQKTPQQVNGTLPVGELPDACKGVPVAAQEAAVPTSLLEAKHPVTEAAKAGWFVKDSLSLAQVKELRARGVSEQFYVDHDLKLLYCVIPKAGCTTYKSWMLQNAGLFKGGNVHNRELYNGARIQNGQFISDEKLLEILNGGSYFKFTITRSPYTRVLATYLERFNECEKQARRTKAECDMWKRAVTGGALPLPRDNMTFVDYLSTMKAHKLTVVDFRNAHWVPGVQICGLDHIKYDWVGRLEDTDDSKVLYDLVGQKPLAKHVLKNTRHSEGTAGKMASYYNEEAKRLVHELYSDSDVSRLGYIPNGV